MIYAAAIYLAIGCLIFIPVSADPDIQADIREQPVWAFIASFLFVLTWPLALTISKES